MYRLIFSAILLLHVIACFAIGSTALINPEFGSKTGFQLEYTASLQIPLIIIGMEVLFLGSIALLGFIWTRRGSVYGIYTGAAVGVYMFVFGFALFLLEGRTDGLLLDSSRGIITIIAAFLALRELRTTQHNA